MKLMTKLVRFVQAVELNHMEDRTIELSYGAENPPVLTLIDAEIALHISRKVGLQGRPYIDWRSNANL